MKKAPLFSIASAVILCIALATPASAYIYSGAWAPNDTDMFAIELSMSSGAGSLYMYDFDEGISESLLVLMDGSFTSNNVYFTQTGGNWYASTSSGGTNLDLGSSLDFGFFFGNSGSTFLSYDLTEIVPGDDYQLFSVETGMTVRTHDAAPVPEAGTFLLLGSGLLGLGIFARRFV